MRINYYSILGFVIVTFLFFGNVKIASAQIKIGTNGSIIAPASILELESNNQGLLLPRLADTVAINTLNPPNGMLIFLTKWPAVGLYVRKATGWEFLSGSLGGNASFNNLTVGGTLIAENFSGTLIGNASTATLATTATNAVNVNITNDLSTSTITYPTFVTNSPGSTSMRTSNTKLSFVPNTGILSAIGFKGNLVGDVTGVATSSIDAINASNTDIQDDVVSNGIQYPTFVSATSGNLPQKTSSSNLTYIPLTGELKALKFNGSLQGNASSATQAQDAVNSRNSRITDDIATTGVSYPVFVNSIFGNQPIKSSSSNLTYVPSTGILSAKGFVGNLVGDVNGQASSALNANNANKALNATNTENSAITDDNSSITKYYPIFVGATPGNQAIKSSSSNLSYVPSTGILTAKGFVGNLVGDVTGRVSNALLADNASKLEVGEVMSSVGTYYPTLVSATTGQTSIKVNNSQLKYLPAVGELISPKFRGELIGNASSTTTATNASNVVVTDDSANSLPTYPVFVNAISGAQAIKSSSSNLSYVPSTGILSAKGFVGNLVGDVDGQASSALNAINANKALNATNTENSAITDDYSSTTKFYPIFVGATSGNQAIKSSSSNLSYVPSTGILTAKGFVGNLVGNVNGQASSALNAINANKALNATNTENSAITDDNSSITKFYPTFVGATPGNQAIKSSSSNLSYVPSTGILTAKGFVGNLVGDVTGRVSNAQLADNASKLEVGEVVSGITSYYPTLVSATTGQTSIKVNNSQLKYLPASGELISPKFNGELIGNASTSTNASNATNVVVTDDSANSLPTYPVFVNAITGSQAIKSSSSNLSYVPSTGILTAKGFVGNLVGNVNGQASSALNAINANKALNATNTENSAITDDNSSITKFYPTFVGATPGNQAIKSSSSNLSYVPSTGILTAKGFVGNLVGDVTGRVSNALLADNASKLEVGEVVPSVGTYYPTLVSATTGQTSIKVNNSQLKYLPAVGELISPKFRGELIGNASSTTTATNASNVSITDDITNNLPTYPVFVNSPTGNQALKSSSTYLEYRPNSGILKANGFVGNLVGNVTGEVSNAQNAINASKINVTTDDSNSGTLFPVFVSGISGNLPPMVHSNFNFLGFKPLTGELNAKIFKGDLVGNANSATSATTATNSLNSIIADENSSSSTFFPTFVGIASGNQPIKASSTNLSFVPSTGILKAKGFVGNLTGDVSGQASSAINALNSNNAVNATNTVNATISDDNSSTNSFFPVFVGTASGNQAIKASSNSLSYVPSLGTLKAKVFEGDFKGDLKGIADNALESTNSANVSITNDPVSDKSLHLTFVNYDGPSSTSLPINIHSSKLTYNPSKEELKSKIFIGSLEGNAASANSISPGGLVSVANGGTGIQSYTPGDILYAENANTFKKTPIGPLGSVLRVEQPGGLGTALVPSWATTGPGTITGVQFGGTGLSSITPGGVLIGNGTNDISTVWGAIGQVLRSNGPGLAPSFQNTAGGDMILAGVQVVTGAKTFGTQGINGVLQLAGVESGVTILNGPGKGIGGTVELPQRGTLATLEETETLTKKTLIAPTLTSPKIGDAVGASLVLNSGQILTTTNQTGTGRIVMSQDAQLVRPIIGDATGSSLNVGGGTITAGSFVGTLNGNVSGNANNVSGIVQILNGGTGANTKQTGFDNLSPMTSPGDMIYGETLGSARRLALGGANQVLKGGLTTPQWGSVNLVSDVTGVLPTQNGGTGNAFTEFTGPFITKKVYTLPNFDASLAVTNAGQTFTGTQIFTSTIDGNISSANTATKLAATKNINGVPFDGSADIMVNADASTLTGTTLKATVLNSNLTSVGTLTNLTVANPIVASITGNAATATTASTVTTNANLTGEVTSVGNLTSVTNNAVITKILTGYSSAAGVVSPADNIVIAISKLSGNIAASGNATHTGDVEGATNLTIKDGAVKTSKIDAEAVTLDKIKNVATNTVLGRATGGTGTLEEISTIGTGNVVRATSPTLITPNIGVASATSLTVSGIITSNIADGNAPFVVTSKTPVTNLSVGGNAGSATKLATARAINGVNFDGTIPITILAEASTLTGNTLNPAITTSSLTSVGTLGTLTVTNPIVGSVTGNADGNAATATKLIAPKTIYGNAFDGTAILDQVIAPNFGGTGTAFAKFIVSSAALREYTLPTSNAVLARTDAAQTFNGVQTFNDPIAGSVTGNAATATTASALNSGTTINSPSLITPLLGTASATSINKVSIIAPAVSATLSLAEASTLATSGANSITLTSTGATNVTLPTSGILVSAISVSGILDFASVAIGESAILTIAVNGAVDGDVVSLGVPNALASVGGIYTAWVSANDIVTVKFTNTTAAAINPLDGLFKIKILK